MSQVRPIKVLITITILFNGWHCFGQVSVVDSSYNNLFSKGEYSKRSTDSVLLSKMENVIRSQKSISNISENIHLIVPPSKGVLLFKKRYPKRDYEAVGKLIEPSMVLVDTIFYNAVFKIDSTGRFSFNVWFALRINGEMFYTDYQTHDFLASQYQMKNVSKILAVYAQSTGYDNYYDNGYPDNFHVVVFNQKEKKLSMAYCSKRLPFEFGDEFWDERFITYTKGVNEEELTINLWGNNLIWTGREIKSANENNILKHK